jgi:hypothetical protein
MPDGDEGGESPCFAHLFEDEEEPEIPAPDRVIVDTVSARGVTPAE